MFAEQRCSDSALGAALQVAEKLLVSINCVKNVTEEGTLITIYSCLV